jgi:hypothetical protein
MLCGRVGVFYDLARQFRRLGVPRERITAEFEFR